MAHELSVLSSIQTVECVLQSSVATISWDATTELGHHINEVHIRLADRTTHTISINRLAGGKAEDSSNHVVRAIDEMCQTYADFHEMAFSVVRGKLLTKIKTVKEAVTQHFKDKKVTLKGNALILVTELLRLFTKEALIRAATQAQNEGDERVTIDHLEKILPQLLLDM